MSNYVNDMTNEEIWEMLRPKMEKNALTTKNIHAGLFGPIYTYNAKDVHNAIALAYKVGYRRAMKGRPFKFGEKKKKDGHWEPVDPNNLPKEGTRARYTREYEGYKTGNASEWIYLNDIGTVKMEDKWFGITLDNPHCFIKWICFDGIANCLDVWVEDDE